MPSRGPRALSEFRLEGVSTNIAFLRNVLAHPDFVGGAVHTRWLEEHLATLAAPVERRQRFVRRRRGIGRARIRPRRRCGEEQGSVGAVRP